MVVLEKRLGEEMMIKKLNRGSLYTREREKKKKRPSVCD
jgi:hypothetical protein